MSTARKTVPQMLAELRKDLAWLTAEHQKYLADDPTAASDAEFSEVLSRWDTRELLFRDAQRQAGQAPHCITMAGYCPEDAPVKCYWCVLQDGLRER